MALANAAGRNGCFAWPRVDHPDSEQWDCAFYRRFAIPRTALVKDIEQVRWAIEHAGGSPVTLKPLAGSKGEGVVRGDSDEGARFMMEALLLLDQDVLVQEYIGEASGRHVSILICGDKVFCAVRQAGRFRSNILQGGQGTAFTPNRTLSELARQAAQMRRPIGWT
jgi:glutathione synthase/RimK-type ligase-like ATP-grasp enzyme